MNTSSRQSWLNGTAQTQIKWANLSPVTITIALVGMVWTIGANLFILVCFLRNRRRVWTSFSRQTLSMTIGDLIFGCAAIPFLINEVYGGLFGWFVCVSVFYIFISIQTVTLFHVLGICIFRNFTLKTCNEPARESSQFVFASAVIVVSWTIPTVIMLMPFLFWSYDIDGQFVCQLETVFKTDHRQAVMYIGGCLFTLQTLTNVIYLLTCYRIWRVMRRIAPAQHGVQAINVLPVNATRTSDMKSTSYQTGTTNQCTSSHEPATLPSQPQLSSLRNQKQVFSTVGILLVVFNICTLPFTISTFRVNAGSLGRDARFLVSLLFLVNSGLNPVVYATRIKSIRDSIIKMARDARQTLQFC